VSRWACWGASRSSTGRPSGRAHAPTSPTPTCTPPRPTCLQVGAAGGSTNRASHVHQQSPCAWRTCHGGPDLLRAAHSAGATEAAFNRVRDSVKIPMYGACVCLLEGYRYVVPRGLPSVGLPLRGSTSAHGCTHRCSLLPWGVMCPCTTSTAVLSVTAHNVLLHGPQAATATHTGCWQRGMRTSCARLT
jgi:hypothetical protein